MLIDYNLQWRDLIMFAIIYGFSKGIKEWQVDFQYISSISKMGKLAMKNSLKRLLLRNLITIRETEENVFVKSIK